MLQDDKVLFSCMYPNKSKNTFLGHFLRSLISHFKKERTQICMYLKMVIQVTFVKIFSCILRKLNYFQLRTLSDIIYYTNSNNYSICLLQALQTESFLCGCFPRYLYRLTYSENSQIIQKTLLLICNNVCMFNLLYSMYPSLQNYKTMWIVK